METTTHKMSEHWKNILFCAVFFPACLSSLTCYLASIPVLSIDRLFLVAVYMLLQFAMACWVLGASNLPSWWRFGTLVLCLVLINLQALPFVNSPIHPPLFVGQIGFLTSIAILGAGVCNLRILFCSVGILMLWRWKLDPYAQDVAFVEIIASAVICLLLRLVGVRISRIPISIPMKRQFGIRQMLFATSLFAVASAFAPSLVEALSRVGISLWTVFFAISGADVSRYCP